MILEKSHPLATCPHGFRISAYLQELMVYLYSDHVFEQASETLEKLLGIKVSAKQIERVSERIGQIMEDEQVLRSSKAEVKPYTDTISTHYHYIEMNGSMILTREEKWKEVKLGRVFKVPIKEDLEASQIDIGKSEYVAHLGSSEEFLPRLQAIILKVQHPIFIADGAPWIWKWVTEKYPNAVQILDYFHAMEYAHDFAKVAFKEKVDYDNWIGGVENYLLTDRVEALTHHMDWLAERIIPESLPMLKRLKEYYLKNLQRMYYGTLRKNGVFIGSGAIESAHRNVIQKRVKLSGQRWSKKGAQAMLQLRVTKKSANWNKIINIIRTGKAAA
ncbi:hypothetical protein [Chondrinema litorale]|uniref:hypothetical protein n=1 Tax=Chondrinema litorale TaxID=2994555 RepID=UPI002543B187|nr:hypothetical protein [Chondrinema litorale]UZR98547.1 hypothetical protein OQ292_31585 [Chondrinema litorale]